jgi:hypothetical protein
VPALIGVLGGGLDAYAIAHKQSKELLDRDAADRELLAKERAAALYVKIEATVNSILSAAKTLRQFRPAPEPIQSSLSERIPSVSLPLNELIAFAPEDFQPLVKTKNFEYISAILLLSRQHAALFSAMSSYSERKVALHDALDQKKVDAGRDSTGFKYRVSPSDAAAYEFQRLQLDQFAVGLLSLSAEAVVNAIEVAAGYGPAMEQAFPDKSFPRFEPISPDIIKAITDVPSA